MHGLINRAVQAFVISTYGDKRWGEIMDDSELGFSEFEAMLVYPEDQSSRMLRALERNLQRPLAEILEARQPNLRMQAFHSTLIAEMAATLGYD